MIRGQQQRARSDCHFGRIDHCSCAGETCEKKPNPGPTADQQAVADAITERQQAIEHGAALQRVQALHDEISQLENPDADVAELRARGLLR